MEKNQERVLAYKKAQQIDNESLGKVCGGSATGTIDMTLLATNTPYGSDMKNDLAYD